MLRLDSEGFHFNLEASLYIYGTPPEGGRERGRAVKMGERERGKE